MARSTADTPPEPTPIGTAQVPVSQILTGPGPLPAPPSAPAIPVSAIDFRPAPLPAEPEPILPLSSIDLDPGAVTLNLYQDVGNIVGPSGIQVFYQGDLLTQSVQRFNFIGNAVIATTDGNFVTVDINSTGGGGGNGTPGGENTQIQFNDNGAFGGYSGFTFDVDTLLTTLPGDLTFNSANITNANVVFSNSWRGTTLSATGNIIGGNITISSNVGQATSTISTTLANLSINAGTQVNVLKKVSLSDTTESTNTVTGSFVTAGGVGIAKNLNVGGLIEAAGNITGNYIIGNGSLLTDLPAADTGNIGFIGDAIYDINGIYLENADLTHGATASLILPANGNTQSVQVNNIYGNILLQAGADHVVTAGWTFDNTGTLTFPDNSGEGWPINQQRFGMGNIGAWLDGSWTIGEFSGNGVSGAVGIRIDPGIEGNTGINLPSQADSVTQPTQIYNTGGGNITLFTDYAGNTWTFDNTGALNVPNHGVIRQNGPVNIVATDYAQLQWVDSGNVNIPDPNASGGPKNWAYVDAGGFHVETNLNNGGNSYAWDFDNNGNFTTTANIVGGNVFAVSNFVGANVRTNLTDFNWSEFITGIATGATTVVTLANNVFGDPWSGQVTITGVTGTTEANDTWWYQAVDSNQFGLYTDNTFTTPVDSTTWGAYTGGGFAVTLNYANIAINGQNVTIRSDHGDYGNKIWTFNRAGQTVFPYQDVARGDNPSGNITGYTMVMGDGTGEAIISTPDGNINGTWSSQRLVINPGKGGDGTSGEGGDIYLWAGRGGNTGGSGGDIKIRGGQGGASNGQGGYIRMEGGDGDSAGGAPGFIEITGGSGGVGQNGGYVRIQGGQGQNNGGDANITGGVGQGGPGGPVNIVGGVSGLGLADYGNVNITSGASTWTFDNTGALRLPGGTGTVESSANNISIYSDAGQLNGMVMYDTGAEIYALQDFAIFTDNANASHIWRFYANGSMTAPGAINVGNMSIGTVPGDITATNNTTVAFNVTGSDGGFLVDYLKEVGNANTSGGELAFSSELGNATYRISLSDDLGNGFATKIWRFDGTGNITLPAGGNIVGVTANNTGHINWIGNSSGDGYGYTTMNLVPDNTVGDSYLIVDPTSPSHIHIRAGGTQDNSGAQLYLGGETSHFKVDNGLNPNVSVAANNYVWTFGSSGPYGELTLPGEGIIRALDDTINLVSLNTTTGNANSVYLGSSGGLGFSDSEIGGNWLEIFRSGTEPQITVPVGRGNLTIQTAEGGNTYNWIYDNTGNLTLPGNTFQVNYANGTQVTLGGGSYGNADVATFLAAYGSNTISTSGNITAGNLIGNISITGNIQGTSSNVTLVAGSYSATFDNTGYLTLPTIGGDEGGELHLGVPAANTTLQDTVKIDVYQDRIRFFEGSANAKGAYIDLANCANGVSTAIGYRDIPQITFSANATAAVNAAGCHYYSTTAGNLALTLPDNSSVAFPTGATLTIVVNAAGNVLVNQGTGVTLYQAGASATGNRVVGAYGLATVMKVAANTWVISGTGVY